MLRCFFPRWAKPRDMQVLYKSIDIWDVDKKEVFYSFEKDNNYVSCVVFSLNGRLLATGHFEGAYVWDLHTCQRIACFEGDGCSSVFVFAFSPCGRTLAMGSSKSVKLFDMEKQTPVASFEPCVGVTFSPDGRTVMAVSGGGTVMKYINF